MLLSKRSVETKHTYRIFVQRPQSKAKELAKQLGVSLVRITSFYENNGGPGPIIYGMGGGAKTMTVDSVAVAPNIPTGEQKVTSDVTITYEIN